MSEGNKKLESAWWTSSFSGVIELQRDWKAERNPPVTLGEKRVAFKELERASPLIFAQHSGYFVDGDWVVFVLFPELYKHADLRGEEIYVAGSFNNWAEAIGNRIWRLEPREYEGKEILALKYRPPGGLKKPLPFKFVTSKSAWLEPPEDANLLEHEGVHNLAVRSTRTGKHLFQFEVEQEHGLAVHDTVFWHTDSHEESVGIQPGRYLQTFRTEAALGAICEKARTIFRIFAPRANLVQVVFYDNLKKTNARTLNLMYVEGVWEGVHGENLHGWYYHFHVHGENHTNHDGFDPEFPILDPYAKACLGASGPGIIIDANQVHRPAKWFQPPEWQDLMICEAHVRDLVAKAPIDLTDDERMGFTGLAKFVRSKESYFNDLPVNAVELQPIQEFDNTSREEYHWGYMTCNFFSPESTYALAPEKASQIEEFQDCVAAFHEQGIAVLLDVVYNHVGVPSHLLPIDKHYYFSLDHDGNLTNWSGVGNDLHCASPMAKRLIIDSLKWLVEVYDVDGFRFDLAELIGMEVLLEIEAALKKIKPSIILIAEPWSYRGHIAWSLKKSGYAFWNDGYRDFLAKFVWGEGNQDGMRYFLAGSLSHLARFPAQSVNYIESHDDFAFLDRITERDKHNGSDPTPNDEARVRLALAIVFASVGMPMISAGQDFLRSKEGVHNTYQRGDLNALDYARAKKYPEAANFVRGWVAFRRSELSAALRLRDRPGEGYFRFLGVEDRSTTAVLYNADGSRPVPQVFFAANPHPETQEIDLQGIDLAAFRVVSDGKAFDVEGLTEHDLALENGRLRLPGLCSALFVAAG